jgi:serine/threonine protein kinase/tetratricopeptide (TPR) repeat protein
MRAGSVVLDRFVIERPAGAGGMGAVFRALDRETGLPVAVKVMLADRAYAAGRFEQEARVLLELTHPAIVRYVAHGQTPAGEPFLAMEWLEGEDLATRLSRGRLSTLESVTMATRVAEALGEAHRRGIIHRDMKPENLFLVDKDPTRVKVLDFGIARLGRAPRMTHTGVVLGTPGYMAPEQVRSNEKLDARADVFALGCVLFECLTGMPAFTGSNVMAILTKIAFNEVPHTRELQPDMPEPLDALVACMLAKHPSARPNDGNEVAAALKAIPHAKLAAAQVRALALTLPDMPVSRSPNKAQGSAGAKAPDAAQPGSSPTPRAEAADSESSPAEVLTRSERRLLSILLMAPEKPTENLRGAWRRADAAILKDLIPRSVRAQGARVELLTNGAAAVTLTGTMVATDRAAQAARSALALRAHAPGRRIALATGLSEATDKMPMGDVIERAAAMLQGLSRAAPLSPESAKALPIAIDEVTAGLLDARFEVRRGPNGFELLEERAGMDGTRPLLGKPTACVGRHREIALLEAILAECAEESVARAVVVTAPAGIGKSRLAHELLRAVRRRSQAAMAMQAARAAQAGDEGTSVTGRPPAPAIKVEIWIARGDSLWAGSAFGLLRQAIWSACDIHGGEGIEERRAKLMARVERHVAPADQRWVAEFLGELIGAPSSDEEASPPLRAARQDLELMSDQLRRAWQSFLRAETAAHPVLLVLDDLHWGDFLTVRAVDIALRSLKNRPWMVLALARPEVEELFPDLWTKRGAVGIHLGALGQKASERLVRQALGEGASQKTVERLVAQAEGNAFYLEELIRAVAEGHGDKLPETVLSMVQARLDALEADARQILRAASVFGEVFWQGGIAKLIGPSIPAPQMERWITSLVEREVIVRRIESRFAGEPELAFRHALLREGAYAMLTDVDRALGHRLAGEWLSPRGADEPAVLAEHFDRGGASLQASSYYLRAAEQALRGGDTETAVARARRGLACGAEGDPRIALLGVLCEAHALSAWRKDSLEESMAYVDEVMRLSAPGSAPWARALSAKCLNSVQLGRFDDAIAALNAAGSVEPLPDAEGTLALGLNLGVSVLYLAGRFDLMKAIAPRAQALAEPLAEEDPLIRARLYLHRSIAELLANEDPWSSLKLAQSAKETCGAIKLDRGALAAQIMIGASLSGLGLFQQAARELRAVTVMEARLGPIASLGPLVLVGALIELGALDDAAAEARMLIETGVTQKSPLDEGRGRWALAEVLRRRGDLDGAERELGAAVGKLGVIPLDCVAAGVSLASLLLARGRALDALRFTRQAMSECESWKAFGIKGSFIRLVHAEALFAAGYEKTARAALAAAQARLLERAAAIDDLAMRRSFLERVPENARTLALACERLGDVASAGT